MSPLLLDTWLKHRNTLLTNTWHDLHYNLTYDSTTIWHMAYYKLKHDLTAT